MDIKISKTDEKQMITQSKEMIRKANIDIIAAEAIIKYIGER